MIQACLSWRDDEVCYECWHWPLYTVAGSDVDGLLMEFCKDDSLIAVFEPGVVLGMQGVTGSGNIMLAPEYLLTSLYRCFHSHPCICLVHDSVFSARNMVEGLVDIFGWRRDRILLKSSVDAADVFHKGWKRLSVSNYRILWEWFTFRSQTMIAGGIVFAYEL